MDNLQPEKHRCGVCGSEFESEQAYLDHQCRTGYTPTDPEHLGENFVAVSEAALARGNERARLENEGMAPEQAVELTRTITNSNQTVENGEVVTNGEVVSE